MDQETPKHKTRFEEIKRFFERGATGQNVNKQTEDKSRRRRSSIQRLKGHLLDIRKRFSITQKNTKDSQNTITIHYSLDEGPESAEGKDLVTPMISPPKCPR